MRIDCIHGYFKIFETSPGQLSEFVSSYGFSIKRSGDHFTFAKLVDAPNYSLAGGVFLGAPTTKRFSGQPWEVMRENGLVYNFSLDVVVPTATIIQRTELEQVGYVWSSKGLLLPGSLTEDGSRVKGYAAFYSSEKAQFRYSEVSYE